MLSLYLSIACFTFGFSASINHKKTTIVHPTSSPECYNLKSTNIKTNTSKKKKKSTKLQWKRVGYWSLTKWFEKVIVSQCQGGKQKQQTLWRCSQHFSNSWTVVTICNTVCCINNSPKVSTYCFALNVRCHICRFTNFIAQLPPV